MGYFATIAVRARTSKILADGNLDMKGYRIINLGDAINDTDAVNLLNTFIEVLIFG